MRGAFELMASPIVRNQSNISLNPTVNNFTNNLLWDKLNLPKTPLFGTDGIRGKVGDILDVPLALQIGFWTGVVLNIHTSHIGPVILGQDSRNSSGVLAMALSAGLKAAGLEVWYLGLCPTPCVAYLINQTNAMGGAMISASHNPPEDNGIKIFGSNGTKLNQLLQAEIETGIRENVCPTITISGLGKCYARPELIKNYSEAIKVPFSTNQLQGMKIVLDVAWGASVGLASSVFESMGAKVICLHNSADGNRINVGCGSTHLDILQASVKQNEADLGFAFDGDADRVLAVDNQGREVNGDYILYIWGNYLRQKQKLPNNLIISTVMANLGLEKVWKKNGGNFIRTKVGDQHVQAEMLNTGSMLGGEQSGHILCHHYGIAGDGLLTALHVSSLVNESGVSLSEIVDKSFQTYPQLLRNIRVEDKSKFANWQECQPLQMVIASAKNAIGDRGRILVRASGTEPCIRVMVEAEVAELAQKWLNKLVVIIQKELSD